MSENPSFSCQWHNGSAITDATCCILQDRLDIHTSQEQFCVDFSVIQNALEYFVWVLLSFPFLAIYNSCAALCRSMGDSKTSLKVSLMMNLTNIAGNAILIYGAKIGVRGAGISTMVSRFVAAVVMIHVLNPNSGKQIYLAAS